MNTKKEVMAAWKDIPASYIAVQMTALGRGQHWTKCSKGMMADALCGKDPRYNYTDVNPKDIGQRARERWMQRMTEAERKLRVEKQNATRRSLLSLSLDEVRQKLRDLAKTDIGQKAIKSEQFKKAKETGRATLEARIDRAYAELYVSELLILQKAIDSMSRSATKETP